ncbi:NAD-dependent epimerase/dehydratase family protein [Candidatus Solirubrobacter pratensis]|uniref:NAD-dependent epimerase/dehydratase family protein n=1 Tax=Candidatus Solirubrobacter pratensis TaxID=1298857 RepID=UPI0004859352|nr:NAD(P)-dependent oxidoreductase [Candidatus Solirubrobacter pratensis]
MKIFLAGATGALGRQLVPRLVERGHEVTGMTRSESKRQLVQELGGRPVVADALDPESVADAVARAEPEVIVHQLTAIPHALDMRHFARDFAQTNRLRTEGTDHLLAAARAVGVRRFVAQSYAPAVFARVGGPVKTEQDPVDANPPSAIRTTLEAIVHLERAVTGATWTEGVVLRYGGFYGPGTNVSFGPEGTMVEAVRKRKLPLVGDAGGVWSFIHIEDAAEATVSAIEGRGRGVYNVVDDEPAAVAEWLPAAAAAWGGSAPRRVPRWLGRLFAGEFATVMMTEARGASNAKAKRELGWAPRYASWREGFATGMK